VTASLDPRLLDATLRKLGVERPRNDLAGLTAVYRRWCERVPFDNSRKLAHVTANDPAPLPGDRPDDFLRGWLTHGTGGTCWAGHGALHALLCALGFEASRGIATMLVAPDLPPNHGTVVVDLPEGRFLVDASLLHRDPLPLRDEATAIDHFAWGVRATPQPDGRPLVHWYPFHLEQGMDCRLESFGASAEDFRELHEATRAWSPFNYSLCLRLVRGDRSLGFWFGSYGERSASGERCFEGRDPKWRETFLQETVGFSREHVASIPPDREVAPPPRGA
jgi:hypothetical protein